MHSRRNNYGASILRLGIFTALLGNLSAADRPPNIVIIYADDLGYGDLGCYGSKIPTPHLDRLAAEGCRFTSFYTAQAVCSASRAALLTGCYPNRVSIAGALGPKQRIGLHYDEVTLAELVKQKQYATAIFGKWHLGHLPEFLPQTQGFDEYFGLPYSNDMWPHRADLQPGSHPDLPLIEGLETIEHNPDQSQLTARYTQHAVDFIQRHKDEPFLLYVPQTMPHVPLFASERFLGGSPLGLYADVICEIDWSVGEILKALAEQNLDDQTLVIFSSDNGPWLSYGHHAGSAGPLREGKGTAWDGGVRVPCLMRWPGKIPAGRVCHEPAMTIDIFPTVARLTGAELPNHQIDGSDIWPLLTGDGEAEASAKRKPYFFYWNNELHAVRLGPWKLHFPHPYRSLDKPGAGGVPGNYVQKQTELELYELDHDIGEQTNVAADHPEIVKQLSELADAMRQTDLGDSLQNLPGPQVRPVGKLPD